MLVIIAKMIEGAWEDIQGSVESVAEDGRFGVKYRNRRLDGLWKRLDCIKRTVLCCLACILLFSACGKEQQEQEQPGTHGQPETQQQPGQEGEYLYVPEQVEGILPELDILGQRNFVVNGDYLYWLTDGIYRIPLGEKLDFAQKETFAQRNSLLESERENIEYFTVDQNQNLYYITVSYQDMIPTLHKRTAEGDEVYRVSMDEKKSVFSSEPILAVDETGCVYVLSSTSLLRYDPEGNLTGELPLDEEMAGSSLIRNYLMELPDGHIFFFTESGLDGSCRAYEILEGDRPKLQELESLSQEMRQSRPHPGLDGVLIWRNDGGLYRYNLADDSVERVLSWQDCDLYRNDIDTVLQVSEEQLLVLARTGELTAGQQDLLLLTKTPKSQVSQKEIVTLASLFPSDGMEKAAVKFNRGNSQYHVTIERYGATGFFDENEGARVRMDSALMSKEDAPDLLDLTDLDIDKYVEAGILEDLYPYMERGGQIRKDNFLTNLLEGYTFDGKLACIPRAFVFIGAYITDDRILETAEWTMESVLETVRQYPDARLFPEDADTLVQYYGSYLLEKFVDWESGECRFDSEEFSRLLEWVKQESDQNGQEALLNVQYIIGFDDYQKALMDAAGNGEKAILRGLPSESGTDAYTPRVEDVLGISVNSRHKDGAWEFLQFYLQEGTLDEFSYTFPTLLSWLDQVEEYCVTPQYEMVDGKVLTDSDGQPREKPRYTLTRDGYETAFYALEQEEADTLRMALEQIDFRPRGRLAQSVLSILEEEAALFFRGEKTVDETTAVIQNRVRLLLQENL